MLRGLMMDLQSLNLLLVSVSACILLLSSPVNTLHYVTKHSQKTSTSKGNTTQPIAARSPIECTLKCKNHPEGERIPFYSNDNECFCLENDKQGVDSRFQSEGKKIEGSTYLKVLFIYKIYFEFLQMSSETFHQFKVFQTNLFSNCAMFSLDSGDASRYLNGGKPSLYCMQFVGPRHTIVHFGKLQSRWCPLEKEALTKFVMFYQPQNITETLCIIIYLLL